mgnify:CR=1 FL=1
MAAMTYNLKKYLKFIAKKPESLAQVVSIKQGEENACLKAFLINLKKYLFKASDF